MPRAREHAPHARGGAFGIAQEAGTVGEAEELREMQGRARALLPARHDEMVLMEVEIGHEHHARLV